MIKPVLPAALLAATMMTPAAAAQAPAPAARTMTCPVGGASFSYTMPVAHPARGNRPDGKPYGDAVQPTPLPECPDNGLVLYKDYTPEEAIKLEPIVASEAYQALRQSDTQYYRAYWLMKEMGLGPEDYLWALLQASWEAEGKPELRARYQSELAEASAKVAPNMADLNWVGMEARSIDALRELGRFDEALSRIEMMPLQPLDVSMPVGTADSAAVQEARKRRTWLAFVKSLKTAIERKDASLEPLDLLPRVIALERCIDDVRTLGEEGRAFCETEKAAVDQARANRNRMAQEMEALRRSREASGR